MTLSGGTKFGPYEILASLGAGGMGEVYRAKDTRLDREVAIKVLPDAFSHDPDRVVRFEREAKAVAALSHPNILAIYDVGSHDSLRYVVTELLEGETLRERLRRSAIPWRRAVEIATSVSDGLAAAHAKGIIHRDLKPENIFLTKDGVVKILDFGLARVAPGAAVPAELRADSPTMTLDTRPGTVLGTVNYMSPEQISGRPTDPRTDIFSFGCVLYEMISGRRAFGGESVAETTTAILRDEPPTLADSGRVVPVELDRVILRCHEKKPEQRIQSARDLSFALRDLLSDSGLSKRTTAHAGRRMRKMLGVQLVVGVVAVAALLLTLNVGGWRERLFSRPQVGAISSLAVLPFANDSGDNELDYLSDGIAETLINGFSRIEGLNTIPRSTAFRHKGSGVDSVQVGRQLSATAVLSGRVLKRADNLTIQVELTDVAEGRQLWGERYQRKFDDLVEIERDIAKEITDALRLRLTGEEQRKLSRGYSENAEAYQAYLKGRYWFHKPSQEAFKTAITHFERAIQIDPNYALAYSGLADASLLMAVWTVVSPAEVGAKAKTAAMKALELAPTLAEAHTSVGLAAMLLDWNWDVAEREFRRALELDPRYDSAHHMYAHLLVILDRDSEALPAFERAVHLDPSAHNHTVLGMYYITVGRLQDADASFQNALEWDPHSAFTHYFQGWSHERQGQIDRAVASWQKAVVAAKGDSPCLAALAYGYGASGNRVEAQKLLGEILKGESRSYVASIDIAKVHVGLGNFDEAFGLLEKAYASRDPALAFLQVDLGFDPLYGDPRLGDLLKKMNLPPPSAARLKARGFPSTTGSSQQPPTTSRIMLAVLPFDNLSRDPEQDYFSDGLTEEMISQLSRLNPKKLGVIARTSAMHYKNTAKTIDAIGRELGVAYIVEGSVRRAGDRVRITAQLIQVSDQTHLWAQNYERDLKDIFALQSHVAERVAGSLTVELLPATVATSARARTINPAAHEAYLKGRFYWNKRTPDGLQKAVEYFEQAVALDPGWPLAYSGLADAYSMMGVFAPVRSSEAITNSKAAAAIALQLDESLGEAHASRGWIATMYDWDWAVAEREYERAIALSPNYATAHDWYAVYLSLMGRHHEALREITKAQELDPLSLIIGSIAGTVHYGAGDFAQAETRLRKTLELGPDFAFAHMCLAKTLFLQGRLAEAITEAREEVRLSDNDPLHAATLGYVCAKAGHPEEARRILDELAAVSKDAYVAPTHFALVHAGLDERDRMFEWLEKAYQEHDSLLLYTLNDPLLSPMRGDSRFADLVRRVGLPPLAPIPSTTPASGSRLGRPQPPLPRGDQVLLPPLARGDKGGLTAGKIMLAVLPFENLSRDPEQEYFSDGMTEELISQLGRINPEKLDVIARTSAMRYKKTDKSVDQIGRELKVDYIVEGSVRRAADRVRITTQLVHVERQTRLWGESFDRDLKDILALQSDVARAVAQQINVKLNPQEESRLNAIRNVNPAAHEAYLRGRFHWHSRTRAGLQRAIEHFRQAIELDPLYAPAHAGMADAYTHLARHGHVSPKEAFLLAKQAALKAVELDDALAEAHGALAVIALYFDWDWKAAEHELRRAFDLNESYEEAHHQYSHLLLTLGRPDESLTESRRALELNPLDPLLNVHLGWHYMMSRQFDQAIAQLKSVLEMNPNDYQALRHIGWAYMYNSLDAEAIAAFETAGKSGPDNAQAMSALAAAYATGGRDSDARAILQQLEGSLPQRFVSACDIAAVYAALNDVEIALEWLEKAYEERSPRMVELGLDSVFDPLRGDPRFNDLIRRIGLPR